jgi:cyclopropane fatty-acyl-phospholipid synthase-like methyltransferase
MPINVSSSLCRHHGVSGKRDGMLLATVQNWLSGKRSDSTRAGVPADDPADAPPPGVTPAAPPETAPAASRQRRLGGAWPAERIKAAETVWGEGFLTPGGAEEMLRLARPLALSDALSLLVVGAGTGGPVYTVAAELGSWVSGFEADPDLAALAIRRGPKAGLGKRATITTWHPPTPQFRANAFTHGLALEPLRCVLAAPKFDSTLAAIAAAIKPQGQLMLVETVAEAPLNPRDPTVARWLQLERRAVPPPKEAMVTRLLGRLGFDVRVVEDISERHTQQTLLAWNEAVQILRAQSISRIEARELVAEGELWLLRLQLIRTGRLRLLRWHGIGKKGPG